MKFAIAPKPALLFQPSNTPRIRSRSHGLPYNFSLEHVPGRNGDGGCLRLHFGWWQEGGTTRQFIELSSSTQGLAPNVRRSLEPAHPLRKENRRTEKVKREKWARPFSSRIAQWPVASTVLRIASWHLLAAVNTLSKAGSARSFASSGSESRLEYAQ